MQAIYTHTFDINAITRMFHCAHGNRKNKLLRWDSQTCREKHNAAYKNVLFITREGILSALRWRLIPKKGKFNLIEQVPL